VSLQTGQRVKYWRELRGLKQNDLAERADMDSAKLCRIELGHTKARVEDIEAIAKALDLTMAEFFGAEAKAS
jgi:transcriptional regulator with XRE-family HTH domain